MERWRTASSVSREILELKGRLEKKVEEVSSLIVEMGCLPEKAAKRARRKSRIEQMKSASEQEWKSRQSMREALAEERGEHDGRLPAILEDKLYPRRTLESAEVMALRDETAMQQASESPELGPPPVVHFEVADTSVGFESARTSEDEHGDDVMQLHPILERRRKRRTSALLQDMATEAASQPAERDQQVPHLLKSGAKRKLDVSELEEPILQQANEHDNFVFQRKQEVWNNPAVGKKASRFTRPPGREEENPGDASGQSPQKTTASTRKILAPKSTNSPAKRRLRVSEKSDVPKDGREDQQTSTADRLSRRSNLPRQIDIDDTAINPNKRPDDTSLPPKTPAALGEDILSPISTEPSSRVAHQAKEAAILNSVEDVLNGSIGRGSRRARAAVSYAEPNLRDKMRRPGKGFVSAVEGIEKQKDASMNGARGTSVDRARSESVKDTEDQYKMMRVKQEKDGSGDERWKDLPRSVSRKKEDPMSPLEDKEKKDKDRPRESAKNGCGTSIGGLEKAVDRLSIFDPPASSPIEEPKHATTSNDENMIEAATTSRRNPSVRGPGRRHSVQPSSSSSTPTAENPSTVGMSSTRGPLPRPNSAASLHEESLSNAKTAVGGKDLKRSQSVSSNLKARETAAGVEANPSGSTGASASAKLEKSLSRRRSMMV